MHVEFNWARIKAIRRGWHTRARISSATIKIMVAKVQPSGGKNCHIRHHTTDNSDQTKEHVDSCKNSRWWGLIACEGVFRRTRRKVICNIDSGYQRTIICFSCFPRSTRVWRQCSEVIIYPRPDIIATVLGEELMRCSFVSISFKHATGIEGPYLSTFVIPEMIIWWQPILWILFSAFSS